MLAIAIPAHKRPKYLQQVLAALESEPLVFDPAFDETTVHVVVSYDRHESCDASVALASKVVSQVIVHKAQHGFPLGITRHVQWLLNYCVGQGHHNVLLLEEDCVPIGDWRRYLGHELLTGRHVVPLHPDCHAFRDKYYNHDVHQRQSSVRTSSWGVMLSQQFIMRLNHYTAVQEYDWDYALNDCIDAMGYRDKIACPVVPRVKHIGINGVHFNESVYPKKYHDGYKSAEEVFANTA